MFLLKVIVYQGCIAMGSHSAFSVVRIIIINSNSQLVEFCMSYLLYFNQVLFLRTLKSPSTITLMY